MSNRFALIGEDSGLDFGETLSTLKSMQVIGSIHGLVFESEEELLAMWPLDKLLAEIARRSPLGKELE